MKIADYEQAIEALNCGIVLEEVRLQKGKVRQFHGSKDGKHLVWDEFGRCYTLDDGRVMADKLLHGECTEGNSLSREPSYDLDFV